MIITDIYRYMKHLIKKLLREGLMKEDSYPYTINDGNKSRLQATFTTEGLDYLVQLERTEGDYDMFSLTFTVKGQAHDGERQNKDGRHAFRVFQTVIDFTENMAKKHKIKKIVIEGATDEKDNINDRKLSNATARSEIYYNILSKRYPSSAIKKYGKEIWLDMTIIFPESYNNEEGKINELVNTLFELGGKLTSKGDIRNGLGGTDEDEFSLEIELPIPNTGFVYFLIEHFNDENENTLNYTIMDTGQEKRKSYRSFDDIIVYLEIFPTIHRKL